MKTPLLNLFIPVALAYLFVVPAAEAQTQKSIKKTIIVANGDTIINGKRLAEMDKKERERFNKEFNEKEKQQIEEEIDALIKRGKQGDILVRKFPKGDMPEDVLKFKDDSGTLSPDSITWRFHHRIGGDVLAMVPPDERQVGASHPKFDRLMRFDRRSGFREKRNTQSFHFRSTDKEGFATEQNFFVEEAGGVELKNLTGKETIENSLVVEDFALFPNFSSGKTTLSFSLAIKGAAVIKVLDSENKVLFSDKVSGSSETYLKPVNLAKNGVYYISINQNGKWFVRRIVKN